MRIAYEKKINRDIITLWESISGKSVIFWKSEDNMPYVRYVNAYYEAGAFAEWIDNGHNNFADEKTIILCVRLEQGVLFSRGTRYEIDFRK